MGERHVVVRQQAGVGWVEFHRPPRNVFTPEMIQHVLDALAAHQADPAVRVLVIASALPGHFSAGADLALFATLDAAGMARWIGKVHDVVRALRRSPKPALAAIEGMAVGGGLEMTFHCDVRFAADNARLGLPEVNIGFIPPMGTTLALPRLLGRHGATRFLYDGAMVNAAQAQALGLVDEVLPAEGLRAHVQAYGEALAAKPSEVLAAIRARIADSLEQPFEEALRAEFDTAMDLLATENFREGVQAFLDKRKPRWR